MEIKGVGKPISYEIEDWRLFNRPHFHIYTPDERNIQICMFANKYADPENRDRLSKDESLLFNNWMKFNWKTRAYLWCANCYDNRLPIGRNMIDVKDEDIIDYSIILEPDPIEPYYGTISKVIEVGSDYNVGRILIVDGESEKLYSTIPHFVVQSVKGNIPIGLYSSVYLDPQAPTLSKFEREKLQSCLSYGIELNNGSTISLWDYMVESWKMIRYDPSCAKRKMPDYTKIRMHKIAHKEHRY